MAAKKQKKIPVVEDHVKELEEIAQIDELLHGTMMVLYNVCTRLFGPMSKWIKHKDDPVMIEYRKFEKLLARRYGSAKQ